MTSRRPLILITNDDGVSAKGIRILIETTRLIGDVVVMAPSMNSSGKAHSFTGGRPLRVETISEGEGCKIYTCDGTPVDCVKLAAEYFCPRKPDILLSGINHGSNSSINILYSGTMGAAIEAAVGGIPAVGFSLLDFRADADFEPVMPFVKSIILDVLENGLPDDLSLNVNFPVPSDGKIKGVSVCRQSRAQWVDCYEKRIDPHGRPYYWLKGDFVCDDRGLGTDQWALEHDYVSIVPISPDFTDKEAVGILSNRYNRTL